MRQAPQTIVRKVCCKVLRLREGKEARPWRWCKILGNRTLAQGRHGHSYEASLLQASKQASKQVLTLGGPGDLSGGDVSRKVSGYAVACCPKLALACLAIL